MATYYLYKRPIDNSGAVVSETMTVEAWEALETKEARLVFQDTDGNLHDYSEFVSELQISHNDMDGDDAGRSKVNGARMKRAYLGDKHTLNVKMINKMPGGTVAKIFALIVTRDNKLSFRVWYLSPCSNAVRSREVYCSTINYGAQRYDRQTGKCYYDGMNFNLIEM